VNAFVRSQPLLSTLPDPRRQHLARGRVDAIFAEERDLVGNVRLGLGFRHVPLEDHPVEHAAAEERQDFLRIRTHHMSAADLIRGQLALLEPDLVVARLLSVHAQERGAIARRKRRLVIGVAQKEAVRAQRMIRREVQAEVHDAGRRDGVDRPILRFDELGRICDVASNALAVTPRVVVGQHAERTELPRVLVAQEPAIAERCFEAPVRA
jgi:hypothetical protein